MNSKITLPRLVAALAARRGISKRQSEEFLKALFTTVADALVERDTVKIKGLGTFKVSRVDSRKSVNVSTGEDHEIPAHDKVVFVPDKELAAAVNAPFEMFETVELDDAVDENALELAAEADVADLVADLVAEDVPGDMAVEPSEGESVPEPVVAVEPADDMAEEPAEEPTEAPAEEPAGNMAEGVTEEVTEEVSEEVAEQVTEQVAAEASGSESEPEPAAEEPVATGLYSAIEDDPLPSSSLRENIRQQQPDADVEEQADTDVEEQADAGVEEQADADVEELVPVRVEEATAPAVHPKRNRFGKGFIIGFLSACVLMAVGFGVLYVVLTRKIDNMLSYDRGVAAVATVDSVALPESAALSEDPLAESPSADASPEESDGSKLSENATHSGPDTEASDQPRYDTVTTTRYLITMARDYYGDHRFWPYIYKENEAKLGHPNRIRPGTRVVIPDLAKYGVDPSNPADVKKAIQLDREIYRRFQK